MPGEAMDTELGSGIGADSTTIVEKKFTVVLPTDLTDEHFVYELRSNTDKYGVKTLLEALTKYQRSAKLTQRYADKIKNTAAHINGVRTRTQKQGDVHRSARATATKFYESLNTQTLRNHAAMVGMDYDSYDDIESIITTLVEKHLELSNHS